MVVGNPAFTLEELHTFTVDQLHRICGYLGVKYKKKDTKDGLVMKIWDVIKPLERTITIDGVETPISVRLKLIQEALEGN